MLAKQTLALGSQLHGSAGGGICSRIGPSGLSKAGDCAKGKGCGGRGAPRECETARAGKFFGNDPLLQNPPECESAKEGSAAGLNSIL